MKTLFAPPQLIIKPPKDLENAERELYSKDTPMAASDIVFELLRDNYRLADSTPFFKIATQSVTTTELSVISFTMPTGMKGVLKFFGQGAKTADAFNFITWRLLRNGTSLADFGGLAGQVGSVSNPKPVTERLNSGDTIDLRAVASSGTYELYGTLEGWYWPV